MIASGKNPESNLVEIIEIPDHPFFIGVQYHPELKSTVENPHPIFVHFVKAAKEYAEKKEGGEESFAAKRDDLIKGAWFIGAIVEFYTVLQWFNSIVPITQGPAPCLYHLCFAFHPQCAVLFRRYPFKPPIFAGLKKYYTAKHGSQHGYWFCAARSFLFVYLFISSKNSQELEVKKQQYEDSIAIEM